MQVGVLRSVLQPDQETIDTAGNLWIEPADGQEITDPIELFMLDRGRLVGMLEAAAAGEPIDLLMLALEAAALDVADDA